MDRIVQANIPFCVEEQAFRELLRIPGGSRMAEQCSLLLRQASAIAAPKAAYLVSKVHLLAENAVEIEGVRLQSRLLCDNLYKSGKVFPFVATCGAELEEWSLGIQNVVHAFWADAIMFMALGCAVSYLEAGLRTKIGRGVLSSMNPGSLPEWPLSEQTNLFALLGESAASVGVRLTESMSMRPLRSISGIYFVSETGFCSCELCPQERCFTRRAPYKPGLEISHKKGRSVVCQQI